jgi:hypothetical protein
MSFEYIKQIQFSLLNYNANTNCVPVPVATRSKARTVFGRWNTGIVDSNLTRGMDVCLRCPVYVEALRRADPPSKESYQLSK